MQESRKQHKPIRVHSDEKYILKLEREKHLWWTSNISARCDAEYNSMSILLIWQYWCGGRPKYRERHISDWSTQNTPYSDILHVWPQYLEHMSDHST
jgi:hypothetical protein